MTTLFKTQFENGNVNYAVDKRLKTPKAFENARLSTARNQRDKGLSLRTFNAMLLEEKAYETTIVATGTEKEMELLVNKLRAEDVNCINSRDNGEKTTRETETIKVKKEFVKKVGPMLFIEKNKGIKMGLMEKMNFKTKHPLNNEFCLINATITII